MSARSTSTAAEPGEIPVACLEALVDALQDDPFYQAITIDYSGEPLRRRQVLRNYFECSLHEAARTGRCVVHAQPGLGAAAWLLPRAAEADAVEGAQKARRLEALLGPVGNRNYHGIVEFMAPLANVAVPPAAWYLSIVGVDPAAQGRGVGVQLLTATLEEADAVGATCYLETFSTRNPAFYSRLGFERVAEHLEPTTGSRYMVMARAPQRASS